MSFLEKKFSAYAQHKFIPLLVLCTLIVPTYFLLYQKHDSSTKQLVTLEDILTREPPEQQSSINMTLPGHDGLFYLDIDKYPIEGNMVLSFPETKETIQRIILDHLNEQQQPQQQQQSNRHNSYACDQHLPPYFLLRRLVQEYLPLHNNRDDFFDSSTTLNNDIAVPTQQPFMLFPRSKSSFRAGDRVCVRVVVPYQNKSQDDPFRMLYRPYADYQARLASPWWDTWMASLTHVDTNASVPVRLQPWTGHAVLRQSARVLNTVNPSLPEWALLRDEELSEREKTHVYEADVELQQEGRWTLSALLEFVEGRYNFEYGPVTKYEPMEVGTQRITVLGNNKNNSKDQLLLLKEHLQLPLCTRLDHPGRWLPFPPDQNVTTDVMGVTRDGKYWAPFACRYRHIPYDQFVSTCAAQKYPRGINVFGDSNTRRSIKKFLSRGKWCQGWETHRAEHPMFWDDQNVKTKDPAIYQDPHANTTKYQTPQDYTYLHVNQTKSCFCEDYTEYKWNASWFDATARNSTVVLKASSSSTSSSVTLHSYKWDGLTFLNQPAWDTAIPSMPVDVQVAIFSLGNWDAAFSRLDVFLHDLDQLIDQIKHHYDLTKTKIIYRTPQYYCCRVDTSLRARQVSGPRLDVFDKEARHRFTTALNASIWDTYLLGESKTWEEKKSSIGCSSNHVPADEVEIENQILMNGLCNE